MAQQRISRAIAASVTSLGLVVGFAGMAGAATDTSGTISGNGADSSNHVTTRNTTRTSVHNDNDVWVKNNNPQKAETGDAKSYKNVGDASATSGDASNHSTMRASVSLNNNTAAAVGGGSGSADTHATVSGNGADSYNSVKTTNYTSTRVNNDNDVHITNNNWQKAESGDATAAKNVGGGDATSGDASNTSSSEFTVNITN